MTGRVLTDLAVAIADGAATIGEIGTLRYQGELFGPGGLGHDRVAGLGRVQRRGPGPGRAAAPGR